MLRTQYFVSNWRCYLARFSNNGESAVKQCGRLS